MQLVCQNRRARRNYQIERTMEAGLVLQGTEVKSLRLGRANLGDGYVSIENGEAYLYHVHISPFAQGNRYNHEPLRRRKLLLKKEEIRRLKSKVDERGFTLIPLKLYFNDHGKAKVEIALAIGKRKYDKRDVIDREASRKELRKAKEKRRK